MNWEHLPFFTWVLADTASAACPAQTGNLVMISMTYAAVIWEADDPFSMNNCIRSRIIFHNITSECNSTFVFLVLCHNCAICKWHGPSVKRMNFCALRPCFIDHLFLASDFRQVPRRKFLQICPFFIHCWNFHSLRHRNKFWTKLQRCSSFLFLQYGFHDDSAMISPIRSLVNSSASKIHASFVLILLDAPLPQFLRLFIILQGIAGATRVSNFLRAFLMVLLEVLVLRFNEIDPSQFFVRYQDGAFHATTFASPSTSHSFSFLSHSSGHKGSGLDVSCPSR